MNSDEIESQLLNLQTRVRLLEMRQGILPTTKFVPCIRAKHEECAKEILRTDGKKEVCMCNCHLM